MRTCTKCKEIKPDDAFSPSGAYWRSWCKRCNTEDQKARYVPVQDLTVGQPCAWCNEPMPPRTITGGRRRVYCGKVCYKQEMDARKAAKNLAARAARTCRKCSGRLPHPGRVLCDDCKMTPTGHRFDYRVVANLRRYGITREQWDAMLAAQAGLCAICRASEPGGRGNWHIDHCHDTLAVRGLLCHNCNIGMGNFKDNPAILDAAAEYLRRASADVGVRAA